MGMEQCWNGTDSWNLKYWEENTVQCVQQVNECVLSVGGKVLTEGN